MPYFSRLTDIVTCNLTALLADAQDTSHALTQIINEMQEGQSAAERSARTAGENVQRLEGEVAMTRQQIEDWGDRAKLALQQGIENEARRFLLRKREAADLLAGLEQQLQAARDTQQHLRTVQLALQSRLSEARRRRAEWVEGIATPAAPTPAGTTDSGLSDLSDTRAQEIDEELAALRRQLSPPQ